MTKKILIVDCNASGIAGDMLLGALLDLGANVERVISAIKTLQAPEFGYGHIDVAIEEVMRGEFRATQIDVTSTATQKRHGSQLIEVVEKAAAGIYMTEKARLFASKVIRSLIEAEADLHQTSFDEAHLHEVALVDTAAEIIGCAVALDDLHLFEENAEVYSTPLAVGGGVIKFSHGIVSVPAPATLAILKSKSFPFHGGPIEQELATPTGAALLVNLAAEAGSFYPSMAPLKVGYGAGTREFKELPAVLRLTLGRSVESEALGEQVAVLETNIDDVSGEVLGYTIDKLLSEGAKDVTVIPAVTKKSRPAHVVKVIADQKDAAHLSEVLIAETGTLGVRVYFCQRHIINREVASVDLTLLGNRESVQVKISRDARGKVVRVKPEFEDLKRLAEKTNRPLRELLDLATSKAQELYLKGED
ncbi:MAG: nickel pincer cofactor biosynthesis protein LarC [Candidatus Bathyarchaeota archaeon]|nr:nickel pincer cofactor biosynthesis protein LarC [Candidatus Bathyarchaeota archaeon]